MRLFVTGASGFLGTAVVAAAVAAGHEVVGLARLLPPTPDPSVVWSRGDVREQGDWATALAGCDAVVHLAASLSGTEDEQWSVAVDGTRKVVAAMLDAGVGHMVLSSSLAVYDLAALEVDSLVDERTPLESNAGRRDGYTRAKLAQEPIAHEAPSATVLRPGLIWDRAHHWNGGQVLTLGSRLGLTIAGHAALPLTHVANCADAFVAAAERPGIATIANIVDDHCPTRAEFTAALHDAGVRVAPSLRVPWSTAEVVARGAARVAGAFGVTERLPGLLQPPLLAARCKPMRYSNEHARHALSWDPKITIRAALTP